MARLTFYHHSISTSMSQQSMCVSLPMAPWSAFLGLVSQACLACSSAQVVLKWQWYDWTSTHSAGNHHMIGQKAWPSNWLLFVIPRAQMGLW